MNNYCRIDAGIVAEIGQFADNPTGVLFHPDLIWVLDTTGLAQVGWSYVNGVFTAPVVPPVPTPLPPPIPSLSPRQIRLILNQAGLRASVEAAVAAGTQDTKDQWQYSSVFLRNDPLLVTMATALGLTAVAVDTLFINGAKL